MMMMDAAASAASPEFESLKAAYKTYRAMDLAEYSRCAAAAVAGCQEVRLVDGWRDAKSCDDEVFKEKIEVRHIRDGFYHIPNPFSRSGSPPILRALAASAVRDWPLRPGPHRTNLDIEPERPDNPLESFEQQLMKQRLQLPSTWLYRLRWTTLGAQYDWSKRRYDLPAGGSPPEPPQLPPSLAWLTSRLAGLTGAWPPDEFAGQAGIVNYYHPGHSMCFHIDEAEPFQEAPLVSLSMGLPAAYLLAGCQAALKSQSVVTPILLSHGDVVVMTGASRLASHAVPRVFQRLDVDDDGSLSWSTSCFCGDCGGDDSECKTPLRCGLIGRYLQSTRININVRQVLRSGQGWETLVDSGDAAAAACCGGGRVSGNSEYG